MQVYRDSGGGGDQRRDDIPTSDANKPPAPPGGGGQRRDNLPTRLMGSDSSHGRPKGGLPPDGGKTVIRGPHGGTKPVEEDNAMNDPVVGWLVIVEGPGKGKALQLGYGQNAIGRGETARINLNFGDDQISRGGHAIVTYDPRSRKFYVQHGGGTNLTYLNDEPVLIPGELPALSHISIGKTVLRFVPLCGDAFDWQDTEESAEQ